MESEQKEVCPYCKNRDTQRIIDVQDLKPYKDHHKGEPFKAFSCFCCGGKWHFKV